MRLAIMQPYFLPYVGYWQLLEAVDEFVIFDDVHFTPRRWINRNRVLDGDRSRWLTVPLQRASQNRLIRDHRVTDDPSWTSRVLAQAHHALGPRPHRDEALALLENTVQDPPEYLSDLLRRGLMLGTRTFGIDVRVHPTSAALGDTTATGQRRILSICAELGATTYVNPPGGRALYDPQTFAQNGIELRFLEPRLDHSSVDADVMAHSILEPVARVGVETVAEIVRSDWSLAEP